MLEQYRKQYIQSAEQLVLTNNEGVVLKSEQTFITIENGSSIFDLDPFFESLAGVFDTDEKEWVFYCLHLNVGEQIFIVDLQVIKKEKGLLLIFKDLTEHYNSYQKITQTRNESVIQTELTVLKNRDLEERERFKNKFIQNFSHELRNPLTSISAIIDILDDTELTLEQTKMLAFVKESNTNLQLMLEDTLSIGMIDAGKLTLQSKLFNLHKLLELLQFTYTAKAQKNGLTFKSSWDEKIPEFVEGDRLRFFQVVTNLLDNAIKYTDKGSVTLNILLNQKRANKVNMRFQIVDTGAGIADENKAAIFESFNQLQTSEKKRGVGLGLTIAKQLLALMNSEIQLQSELGKGSTFYFDIAFKYPLLKTTEKQGEKNQKDSFLKGFNSKAKFKVLLVEDNEFVQTTLFKILLNTKKFQIDLAYDGALVLQEVINNDYDVILMDVNLPNIDGIQITKLIRDFPFKNINSIPIIGITANAYAKSIEQCLNAGMQKVLTKPFEREALLRALSKVLK